MASYGPFSYVIAKDGGVPLEPLAAPSTTRPTPPPTPRWPT